MNNPDNKDEEENPLDKIEQIKEPLLNADGSLNLDFLKEMKEILESLPNVSPRLEDNPEWNIKKDKWIFRQEIVGAFALWSCRMSPYGVPWGLEVVCKYLNECLKREYKWAKGGMEELSLFEIYQVLNDILIKNGIKQFKDWGKAKSGRTDQSNFLSSFGGTHDPDDDFVDLNALILNVCITIRDDRRIFELSDNVKNKLNNE
jgi:hypothetical protein